MKPRWLEVAGARAPSLSPLVAALLLSTGTARALPDPVAWWPLDDRASPTIELMHGLDGTLASNNGTAPPRWVVGDGTGLTLPPIDCSDDALSFDGVDDYVSIPDDDLPVDLDGFTALTLSVWVRPANTQHGAFLSKYDSRSHTWVSWYIGTDGGAAGKVRFFIGSSTEVWIAANTTDTGVLPGAWYHVAGVWDGVGLAIYIDGVLADTTFTSQGTFTGMYDSQVPVELGAVHSVSGRETGRSSFYAGALDDVRIYDQALTGADIALLAAGRGSLAACDTCPVDCQVGAERIFYAAVRRASDQSLASILCWTLPGGGVDCRRDADGGLLLGPPECGP